MDEVKHMAVKDLMAIQEKLEYLTRLYRFETDSEARRHMAQTIQDLIGLMQFELFSESENST